MGAWKMDLRLGGEGWSHSDVQEELTRATFDHLLPIVSVGCVSQVVCTAMMALFFQDGWLWKLTAVMAVINATRVGVVIAFPLRRREELTPADCQRWENWYGSFTLLYSSSMGAGSLYCFSHHGFQGAFICTLGTVCFCAGLSARVGLRPRIVQAAGLLMLLPLTVAALLFAGQPGIQAGAIPILVFTVVHCQAVASQFRNLVEHLRSKRRLRELAEQDALTGLSNRRHFQELLTKLCGATEPFSILYIDLDRFKRVNDTYGHATGDTLLRMVAERLRAMIRHSDLLARLGGDEFAILQAPLPERDAAMTLARRINAGIAEAFEINGETISIGASVGVQFASATRRNPDRLLSTADEALYQVKQAGGGAFQMAGTLMESYV